MTFEEFSSETIRNDNRSLQLARAQDAVERYGTNACFSTSLSVEMPVELGMFRLITKVTSYPNVGLTTITESPLATKFDGMRGAFSKCIHELSAWARSQDMNYTMKL